MKRERFSFEPLFLSVIPDGQGILSVKKWEICHAKEMHEQVTRDSYLYEYFMVRVRNPGSELFLGW